MACNVCFRHGKCTSRLLAPFRLMASAPSFGRLFGIEGFRRLLLYSCSLGWFACLMFRVLGNACWKRECSDGRWNSWLPGQGKESC